jgi:hypothetical protein
MTTSPVAPSRRAHQRGRLPWLALAWITTLALCAPAPATARERGGDGRFERRGSAHFLLLQDVTFDRRSGGSQAENRFEREVLDVLERAYRTLSDTLGMRPPSDIVVHVYDAATFDARFARLFGFRAAGFFDGTIHVRGGPNVDARLVAVLYHEYVHAVIDSQGGSNVFPSWLNEGMAEYFEGLAIGKRGLAPGERAYLARAAAAGVQVSLLDLSRPFSMAHLTDERAGVAYLTSLGAVDFLLRAGGGMRDFRRFVERALKSRNVERSLDNTYRMRTGDLDAAFSNELLR